MKKLLTLLFLFISFTTFAQKKWEADTLKSVDGKFYATFCKLVDQRVQHEKRYADRIDIYEGDNLIRTIDLKDFKICIYHCPDVSFTDDNSKIYFTSKDVNFVYDIETDKIKMIFQDFSEKFIHKYNGNGKYKIKVNVLAVNWTKTERRKLKNDTLLLEVVKVIGVERPTLTVIDEFYKYIDGKYIDYKPRGYEVYEYIDPITGKEKGYAYFVDGVYYTPKWNEMAEFEREKLPEHFCNPIQ